MKAIDVYRARIHNFAKLSYEAVGTWLEQEGEIPAAVTSLPGMDKQIRLQLETAMRLRELRKQHGALELETIQATPVLNDAGQVTDLAVTKHNTARDIIENFMIAANVAMAQFQEARGEMSLRRVVRTPKQWPRIVEVAQALGEQLPQSADSRALADFLSRRRVADPVQFPDLSLSIVKLLGPGEYVVKNPGSAGDGHFGLAVHDYTHSTAPNRRYADLVTQPRLYCGSTRTGYRQTEHYTRGRLSVTTAVAASGAAISPNMGSRRSDGRCQEVGSHTDQFYR